MIHTVTQRVALMVGHVAESGLAITLELFGALLLRQTLVEAISKV